MAWFREFDPQRRPLWVADDETGRVPIIGVAGSQGVGHIARLTAWFLHLSGKVVGLACSEGLFLGSRCVESGNRANFAAAERLLMNREVNAIVVEKGPVSILDDGLAYDRCQVGLVTDLRGAEAPVDPALAVQRIALNVAVLLKRRSSDDHELRRRRPGRATA